MTTAEQCESILKEIVRRCNDENATVAFQGDWGGNTLTVLHDKSHTHVGVPDGSWDVLVENLHGTLVESRGLSWYTPPDAEQPNTNNGP